MLILYESFLQETEEYVYFACVFRKQPLAFYYYV